MALRNGLGGYGRSVNAKNVRAAILRGYKVYTVNAHDSVISAVTCHGMLVIYNEQLLAVRSRNEHTVTCSVNILCIMQRIVVFMLFIGAENIL